MRNRKVFNLVSNLLMFYGTESVYLPWPTVQRIQRIKRMDAQRQHPNRRKSLPEMQPPYQAQSPQVKKSILTRIASMFPFFNKD